MRYEQTSSSKFPALKFLPLNFHRGGFTLLEVMISVAIIGGLLVTLIYTLNYHLGILERHEIVTIAALLAREKMAELEKISADQKGVFPAPYSDYSYESFIRESHIPGISEVSLIVRRDKEEIRFSELVQKPK